jgi:hypothetical protein
MAKSAAIPLGIGAIGSVMLISGLQNETIAEVIKGEFGKGTKHETPNPSEAELKGEHGGTSSASYLGTQGSEQAQGGVSGLSGGSGESIPGSKLAPEPRAAAEGALKEIEAKGIAAVLLRQKIKNPTRTQINEARAIYNRERAALAGVG